MHEVTKAGSAKILEIINKLPFFEKFGSLERQKIASCFTNILQYNVSEHIIKEDTYDSVFFILLSGSVKVMNEKSGTQLATLKPGQFFGEISFLTKEPRTSSVMAEEIVLVMKIDALLMDNLSAEIREKIKDKVIQQLIDRMKHMNHKMAHFNTISTDANECYSID